MAEDRAPRRLAIISTPRSGNTWLRRLLATIGGLAELAVHQPDDLDWGVLPPRIALQIHWLPTAPMCALLDAHQFRVVTLLRHPLDVLISILQFSFHEPQTAYWLAGSGGTEHAIHGATPLSPAFLDYACGERARALLAVSRSWSGRPGCTSVRYEELVHDPARQLRRLAALLGLDPTRIAATIAEYTLERQRRTSTNQHFWQGSPGLWRRLLPADRARAIAAAHAGTFTAHAYGCDPDPDLTAAAAEAHWRALTLERPPATITSDSHT